MTSYSSEFSTFLTEPMEKQFFFNKFDSEYENEISSISDTSNSFSNNNSLEFINFLENTRNDLIPNQYQFLRSEEKSPLNIFEEQKEEENRYFVEREDINQKNNKNHKLILDNNNSNKSEITPFLTKKKRGRGKQNEQNDSNAKENKIHDKFSTDNLLRKIQVHYLSFIISFLNDILKNLNYSHRFLKLDYEFKKNVNKSFVECLKGKSIGEIICNKISSKYRKQDENNNKNIYEEIQKDEVLNKILSENYLKLFQKIYYKSNIIINLKEYGLDKDIFLSKDVKMYKDLLKGNEAFEGYKDYQKNIDQCAIQNYFPDIIFSFN